MQVWQMQMWQMQARIKWTILIVHLFHLESYSLPQPTIPPRTQPEISQVLATSYYDKV